MLIAHQKVSGVANTDPGKVGGEDWDAPHALGIGAAFAIAQFQFMYDTGTSSFTLYQGSARAPWAASVASRISAGRFKFPLVLTGLPPPVLPGYIAISAIASVAGGVALPSTRTVSAWFDTAEDALVVEIYDIGTDTNVDPPKTYFAVQVMGDVRA